VIVLRSLHRRYILLRLALIQTIIGGVQMTAESIIKLIEERFDPDNDGSSAIPSWTDAKLVLCIKMLLERIVALEAKVSELESKELSPYECAMIVERAKQI
jgi:hypothetical protein